VILIADRSFQPTPKRVSLPKAALTMSLIILSQALKVREARGVTNSKLNNSGISNRGEVALLTEKHDRSSPFVRCPFNILS